MRIIAVQPRGFCAGVDMAVRALDRALSLYAPPIYAFHHIVHNTHVVQEFEGRGVCFVDDLEAIPRGANVVFSAHGVSPQVRAAATARDLHIVDATCPLVQKVHVEASRFAREGYTIIFIGHAAHDETRGVLGEAPERIVVVESESEALTIEVEDPQRVAYLTQTTLGVEDVARIVAALKFRFPSIEGPASDDICYATHNRQAAVRDVAGEADLIIVVGSVTSSNSTRLVEVASSRGVPARLIDGPDDLRMGWFDNVRTVAVTSGASVPEKLFNAVITTLASSFGVGIEKHGNSEEPLTFRLPAAVRTSVPLTSGNDADVNGQKQFQERNAS